MKIIIAGAGEVGYHLAKQLSLDEHDITIIDIDGARLDRIGSNSDVLTIPGSSTSIEILKSAHVENTDLLVAVTSSEAVNVNTAILAKKLGAKRTIARVSNDEYISADFKDMFKNLGVDNLIYPEDLAAIELVKLIERAAATDVIEFENGLLTLIGLKLDKNAKVIHKTMRETASEYHSLNYRIVAIHRGMRTLIPSGNDIFLPNDQIFVITNPGGQDKILELAGKDKTKIENLMILGGGKIGRKAARLLEDEINIKIIEKGKDRSVELADHLQKALVIQGDGRDLDLLAQEGIIDMDAFIAVTNDAETNIITCLMAKHLGVSKTVALVDNVDYVPLTQTIGLDALINKKLITASNISRFIRKSNILTLASLQGIDAEVLEFIARDNSKVTTAPVKNLKFPKNAIIGGYVRDGEGFITVGDSQLQPGDKVVVIALPSDISKVEKYFQ
ncbi:MAG: Trk system potassium transporter TrkA [Melioribacteraceae bacterium]|nr:Trk system potassium transporter TrkA [Melioribacteraceae bacterium]WKZ69204.1 MAG: Trk system potassium transporter TrkA [Melioribacteraceae bacterium]